MGRPTKVPALKVGPKLWARFLKRHFSCSTVTPLNTQLLLYRTPGEVFEFGVFPEPLPRRSAPKVFERAHDLGRDPNGAYVTELYDDGSKFNLYERVTARVPESRYWLLKEIAHFFSPGVPAIEATTNVVLNLLEELGLAMLDRRAVAAWESMNPGSLVRAEKIAIDALFFRTHLPEYLSLGLNLAHLAAWHEPPEGTEALSSRLLQLCPIAAESFVLQIGKRGLDLSGVDCVILTMSIEHAVKVIGRHGARSINADEAREPPLLARRLVLAPRSESCQIAMACLSGAASLQHHAYQSWKVDWPDYSEALRAERINKDSIPAAEAVRILEEATETVPTLLQKRTEKIMDGYHAPTAASAPNVRIPA